MIKPTRSNRRAIIFLAFLVVIFTGPLMVSYLMYNFRMFLPETFSNGHLILPPISLQTLPLENSEGKVVSDKTLKGEWLILYVEPGRCDQTCLDTLYKMRQVRTRLGKNMQRVQRVLLTLNKSDPALSEYLNSLYNGTTHLQTTKTALSKFLIKLPSHNTAITDGYLYIVDPLGNVMMSYHPDQSSNDIYADLKRLLTASNIG